MSEPDPEVAAPPKIFISYRWSSPDHEEWVLRLASSLRSSGVDAQLDKWHLKEGQDTLAFMETMVNDPDVKKVLMICDSGYVDRANSREGGVGTEAQIISAKVYNDTGQDKFAAIVVELDAFGKPLLPVYMSTRLYFDMSNPDSEAVNFERVVRWVFDEPFHVLPPLGARPDFSTKVYATGSPLFRVSTKPIQLGANQSVNDDAQNVLWSISEDAQSFIQNLVDEPAAADLIYKGIKDIKPVLENTYGALRQIISSEQSNSADIIHSFFESMTKYWDYRPQNSRYSGWDNDIFQYFFHDALVSFVAISMQQKAFTLAHDVLAMPFFKPKAYDNTGEAIDYNRFYPYLESLDSYNNSLERRRLSVHADLINELHEHSIVSQTDFMEADLTLYLRGLISPKSNWFPVSALYLSGTSGALPTYVRARSAKFYNRLKPFIYDREADEIRRLLAEQDGSGQGLRFDYRILSLSRLMAAQDLATSA